MCRIKACCAIAGVAFLLTSAIEAQTSQTSAATFTSSTELVLIPTVVNDKSGVHIAGLHKEEFALKQDGKSHPIAVFEEVQTSSSRVRRSEGEHGTFSNFETGGSDYHRLNIIVLDFVNTPFSDEANARNELLKFLSEAAESGEPMCLLALTRSGLTLLHDFTDDPKLLAAALRKVGSNTAPLIHESAVDPGHPPPIDALSKMLTKLIRGQLESEAQLASTETKNTTFITVQAFQQIAKAFRGLPGRKALIWASSGFPFSLSPPSSLMCDPACPVHQRDEVQSSYDNLWRMMNDAQIAIYSVDLRSASSGTMADENTFTHPYDVGDPQFDTEAQAQWKRQDTDSALQLFAENTGGKAFLGSNNLVQSFRQAIQDDNSYYMLGYYVSRSSTKPGWHQIAVTTSRKGAHTRYRNGFFFSRDTSTTSARQDVQLALISPLDFVGVPVSVSWSGSRAGKSAGKTTMQFDLVMPPNFASVDESNQNRMVVDIAAVARNANGEAVAEFSQRIETHLKSGGLEQIQHNGMTYRNGLQLPPGQYTVRFVVRDSIGNRTGSVAATINVAP
ncbi:MAG TPA: VWA domain-containing protein [Terriglobales bacterium]|nr:VWA domain-containing protein [Terriglobales bacterium]